MSQSDESISDFLSGLWTTMSPARADSADSTSGSQSASPDHSAAAASAAAMDRGVHAPPKVAPASRPQPGASGVSPAASHPNAVSAATRGQTPAARPNASGQRPDGNAASIRTAGPGTGQHPAARPAAGRPANSVGTGQRPTQPGPAGTARQGRPTDRPPGRREGAANPASPPSGHPSAGQPTPRVAQTVAPIGAGPGGNSPKTLVSQPSENSLKSVATERTGATGGTNGTAEETEFPTPVIPRPTENDRYFFPPAPRSLEEAGVTEDEVQRLIIKLLASRGALQGRKIAMHVRLPFSVIEHLFLEIRREHLIALKGDAIAGDYTYVITDKGLSRGQELARDCTYYGAAPVPLDQYVAAMTQQSITKARVRDSDLRNAFRDLLMDDGLLQVLGPAINSGRGLFLFGEPGNGKTSIAERVSASFGTTMWIPRCLGIDGEIIRVYDPAIHHICRFDTPGQPPVDEARVDHRWVRVHRPTVIAGGELTMAELEVTRDQNSRICEAPLQLKSNGGVLLIDDFGRQRMPIDELLNRWIVPLEKRYDLLNLPSGKKVRVPFDQLVIFSTNLEPRDLVDDAFLRRIPYKVQVPNPSARQFHRLFALACDQHGVEYNEDAVDYLIDQHFTQTGRALRACYPRDLLMQIRNHCIYEETPFVLSREAMDFAVRCYFSVLS